MIEGSLVYMHTSLIPLLRCFLFLSNVVKWINFDSDSIAANHSAMYAQVRVPYFVPYSYCQTNDGLAKKM